MTLSNVEVLSFVLEMQTVTFNINNETIEA